MVSLNSASDFVHLLQVGSDVVLLENTLGGQGDGWDYLFVDPVHILQIHQASDFLPLLATMQKYVQEGYYLAGYFAYECGYFLEKLGKVAYRDEHAPLAWFGVYRQPYRIDAALREAAWQAYALDHQDEMNCEVQDVRFDLDEETYRQKVERVREHIRAGDVYQINLTGRTHFRFAGSPLALYTRLRRVQRTLYSAYMRIGERAVLSFSPELFFQIDGQHITTRPMKGTAQRGRTLLEDEQQVSWLRGDAKNRAENIMITDLLRNDLGRVCEIGSITVPRLLEVETYETVLQMTSTVTGQLRRDASLEQIFSSLFPCGSVTGAPKLKAMEIIGQLEQTPRGVYTGSIGYIAPPSPQSPVQAMFNVAIRTIDLEHGQGMMGIGSGIVYDSRAAEEAAECAVKARFLTTQAQEFAILESILWDAGYQRLEKHLKRMQDSARYFGYPWDEGRLQALLRRQEREMLPGCAYKVRVLLERSGVFTCESVQVQKSREELVRVIISTERTNSQDRMYFHKTTQRPLYERAFQSAHQHGYADVLFLNERGEVTEGAISNIFIERDGRLLTPPVTCGLLPGIARQCILEEHPNVQEALLTLDDLLTAEKVYICNAIRGLRQVQVITPPAHDQ
ncbi:aminodeoxychorismate synthase component I [Ktedonobacter racemifer]|uniref:Para-aminobenzoate synthase, subunit I n=1 Tax=Ktedonobacter racemifer DSM 44963 TaxID=485913 RepID=D6TVM3_KTERA|nr:aminodeoxychorismate synthase component I [Ktedonobacter racemifer]EFH84256.1 para-aminobenzoate synthase, subunit I [Ktedonobacter racemifer DSM 44963]